MELERVTPELVDELWPRIEEWVSEACSRSSGRYASDHVRRFAKDRIWQLWLVTAGAEVIFVGATENLIYPTGLKTIAWRIGTGEGREFWQREMMEFVLRQAKDEGCEMAEGSFRPGWRRVFPDWKHTHEILERSL